MIRDWFIYETTCTLTGKKYIGRHRRSGNDPRDPDDSWYIGSSCNPEFIEICEHYGREVFTREIIHDHVETEEDAELLEVIELEKVQASSNPMYYNLSNWGGTKHQEGPRNPRYGKKGIYKNKESTTLGRIIMNDGTHQKFVKKEDVESYKSIGWVSGRPKSACEKQRATMTGSTRSLETRKKIGDSQRGQTRSSEFCQKISEIKLQQFAENPELRRQISIRRKGKPTTLGYKCISKGSLRKKVPLDQLEGYLSQGWVSGW